MKRRSKPVKEKVPGTRRGRPALDPAVKEARAMEKAARTQRSGGKRGRPASGTPKVAVPKAPSGKRGRPSLTSEVIAQRVSQRAATRARTGGKRGRPKSTRR